MESRSSVLQPCRILGRKHLGVLDPMWVSHLPARVAKLGNDWQVTLTSAGLVEGTEVAHMSEDALGGQWLL